MPSFTSRILMEEAVKRGWQAQLLDEQVPVILITFPDGATQLLYSCVTPASSAAGYAINHDKQATYAVARHLGLPIVPYQRYDAAEPQAALTFLQSQLALGHRVVVKPADRDHGLGITVGVSSGASLEEAIAYASRFTKKIILQQQQTGDDCRMTVVDGRVVAAARRRAPTVTGDGRRSVRQLLEAENKERLRRSHGSWRLHTIKLEDVQRFIGKSGLRMVPPTGETVTLLGTANFGKGGEVEDITDAVHDSYKQAATTLAQRLGLGVCGVDFICQDITKPMTAQNTALIEINCAIGLRLHHFPTRGKSRNVAGAILDSLAKTSNKTRG